MPMSSEINKYRKELINRYIEQGMGNFLEREILELLLAVSAPKGDTKFLAAQLLQHYKKLSKIHDAPLIELLKIPGINMRSALTIKLVKECSEYYLRQETNKNSLPKSGADILDYCRITMSGIMDENFAVFFLNQHGEVIEVETLIAGAVDQTRIYPRKIIERALFHNAAAFIFAHNHPRGNAQPSLSDRELTDLLVSAARMMELEVFDHIIIGQDGYFSFRDEGLMNALTIFPPVLRMSVQDNKWQEVLV